MNVPRTSRGVVPRWYPGGFRPVRSAAEDTPAPQTRKLTKRVVDALKADPTGKDVIHFDSELRGFGGRIKPSGAKSHVLKYGNRFGQQRKLHVARAGEITPEQARDIAVKLRGRIADGADPAADRSARGAGSPTAAPVRPRVHSQQQLRFDRSEGCQEPCRPVHSRVCDTLWPKDLAPNSPPRRTGETSLPWWVRSHL
jgi:hypothetical protein